MTNDQKQAIRRAERRLKEAQKNYDPSKPETAAALDRAHHGLDTARFFYYTPRGEHD